MNKDDLVVAVANDSGLTKSDAARVVDSLFDAITASLRRSDDVRITGFGTFAVANRAARDGRNPRTGEKIRIPASRQAKFKAGKALKETLN